MFFRSSIPFSIGTEYPAKETSVQVGLAMELEWCTEGGSSHKEHPFYLSDRNLMNLHEIRLRWKSIPSHRLIGAKGISSVVRSQRGRNNRVRECWGETRLPVRVSRGGASHGLKSWAPRRRSKALKVEKRMPTQGINDGDYRGRTGGSGRAGEVPGIKKQEGRGRDDSKWQGVKSHSPTDLRLSKEANGIFKWTWRKKLPR